MIFFFTCGLIRVFVDGSNMRKKEGITAKFAELEKIVAGLSSDIELEEAVKLYEKGMRIATEIRTYLTETERRIRVIGDGGTVTEKEPDELGKPT